MASQERTLHRLKELGCPPTDPEAASGVRARRSTCAGSREGGIQHLRLDEFRLDPDGPRVRVGRLSLEGARVPTGELLLGIFGHGLEREYVNGEAWLEAVQQ